MAIAIKTLDEIESIVNAQTGWIFPYSIAATVDCTQDSARDHLSRLAKKGRIARQWVKLGKQSRYCYARKGSPPPTDLILPPRTFTHEPKVVAFRPNEPGVWKYLRTVTAQMQDGEPVGEVELLLIETQLENAAACDKSREQSALLARCRNLADEQRRALAMAREAAEMASASRLHVGQSLPESAGARPSTCRMRVPRQASAVDRGSSRASAR